MLEREGESLQVLIERRDQVVSTPLCPRGLWFKYQRRDRRLSLISSVPADLNHALTTSFHVFPVHYSLIALSSDALQCDIVTVLLDKPQIFTSALNGNAA